jgi:Cu-Zn family superoxide dismutase
MLILSGRGESKDLGTRTDLRGRAARPCRIDGRASYSPRDAVAKMRYSVCERVSRPSCAAKILLRNERCVVKRILGCAAVVFLLGAFAAWAQESKPKSVTVDIKNAQGQSIGAAVLSPAPKGVKIKLDIKNLPPGDHSIHIHQVAKCEPPDFKSAGPHFDPAGGGHAHSGLPAGDIPDFSLIVAADGTAHASTVAPNVTLGSDDRSVFSNGGTAIVIHAVAGGTGAGAPPRIACGIIAKPE